MQGDRAPAHHEIGKHGPRGAGFRPADALKAMKLAHLLNQSIRDISSPQPG
jgi:hypothetical protein